MKQSNQHHGLGSRLLALTCLFGSIASFPSFAYTLIDLGADVAPKDINNNGIVVGSRNTAQYPASAFRYDIASGQFEDLDGTIAYAVNDAGAVAGNTLAGAFLLDSGNLRTWDDQGAYGISETGLVSGNKAGKNPYRATSIPYNPAVYEGGNNWTVMDIAQVYPRGTRDGVYADIFLLDDINDSGVAVGSKRRYGLAGSSAIMIAPPYDKINDLSDVTYLPTPSGGVASAINNSNIIVGTTGNNSRVDDYATAYVYDGSTLTLLEPLPGGMRSSGLDINNTSTVVGSSETDTLSHAFVWNAASGMEDLNTFAGDSQWVLMSATAINEQGDIVGTGQLNGHNHGFLLVNGDAPPPPPAGNEAPVAIASADVTRGRAALTVNFTGSESYDTDGDNSITYLWDFGDGESSDKADPRHTFTKSGTYLVVLTVKDGQLTNSDQLEIRVRRNKK